MEEEVGDDGRQAPEAPQAGSARRVFDAGGLGGGMRAWEWGCERGWGDEEGRGWLGEEAVVKMDDDDDA